jgi:glycosyltransferase involved in cell wall biosynthesis
MTAPPGRHPAPALLVCPELFASEGGIARISRVYLEVLADLSPAGVRLVVLNDRALPPDLLVRHNPARADLRAVTCARSKTRFLAAVLAATASGCRRSLSTHVHLLPALALARLLRPGLAWDVVLHGIEAWGTPPPAAARALRRARRVYCVSQYTRDVVARREPALSPRLRVLPNAIDPGLASSLASVSPAQAEPGRILAVSRLAPHDHAKGIDHLIQALPAVHAAIPRATLHIVGDGGDRPRLQALAAASPAHEAVIFHGRVDEAGLRDQFARASLFALPSDKEGFGLVYAEAMAAGRPCLAALSGGAPEVVGPDCGILVPYGDICAIAQGCVNALQRIWSAETLRRRAARFGVEAFHRNFRTLWPAP